MFLRNLNIAAFAVLAILSCANVYADETRQFPTLKLVKDCGDCNVDPTVPDLIAQAYLSKRGQSQSCIHNSAIQKIMMPDNVVVAAGIEKRFVRKNCE
jgi:hypothetical protein